MNANDYNGKRDIDWRPVQLTADSAASFDDIDVVNCYAHRPGYSEEAVRILTQLAGGKSGRVLGGWDTFTAEAPRFFHR